MKKINRKEFIKKTAIAGLTAGTIMSSCSTEKENSNNQGPAIITAKKYKWKMVTTWPPNFPVLGEGCVFFANWVREMTAGRLDIRVYGGGELVPALQTFEAVSNGAAEIGSGAAYYWAGKAPSSPFFTTIPFGMNAQQMNAWLYSAGGHELYTELYARYNIVPFLGGNTGMQMGGWFNKEINKPEDLRGLKIRMPGLGGKVIEKAGGTSILSAGGEIYTNLERGVIDAAEWIGPYHDYIFGFHKIAKYYYYPGWHEPGPVLEIIINKRNYDQLPKDLQTILETAAYRFNIWSLSEFEAKNNIYLNKILAESNTELRQYPKEVLETLRIYADEVMNELAAKDSMAKKIYAHYKDFYKNIISWANISEKMYYNVLQQ